MPPRRRQSPAPSGSRPRAAGLAIEAADRPRNKARPVAGLRPPPAETAATPEPPPEPTVEPPAGEVPASQGPDDARSTRGRIRRLVVLAVAAVLLVASAVVLGVTAHAARSNGPLANQAFVDGAATAEVVGQVTAALKTVYSYNHATLDANEAEARAVITGRFAEEFGRVFEPVRQLAPQQQAVLTTTVPAAGVMMLTDDRARLLVMVDQRGVRGPAKEPTSATARLVVDAQWIDGRWKIAQVTPQ